LPVRILYRKDAINLRGMVIVIIKITDYA